MKINCSIKAKLWLFDLCAIKSILPYLLFLIIISLASCKKESKNEKADPLLQEKIREFQSRPKIQTISIGDFRSKINTSALGNLKKLLNVADAPQKLMSLELPETYHGFSIIGDSIKMIKANGHSIYVFAVKPGSSRSIIFQNLTIDESDKGTIAFITTYSPTKLWVEKWRAGLSQVFDGDINITPLNLDNGTQMALPIKSFSLKDAKIASLTAVPKTSSISVCVTYSFYETVAYSCASGRHWPGEACEYAGGEGAAGYGNQIRYITTCQTMDANIGGNSGIGGYTPGTGGSTTPNIPPGYDPCNSTPPSISTLFERGTRLAVVPPPPCDLADPNQPFNEFTPFDIPNDYDIYYPQEYFDTESIYDELTSELIQEGITNTEPIPEAYYKYSTRIDMANATPLNGRRTALGFPSNHRYFWKELAKLRPEMFDEANRARILAKGSPIVNDQWIKYNPTHKAYKDLPLRHHHEGQGRYAYAIPEKVHQKWSAILHSIRTGKFPKLKGTMNSLAGGMQIFSLLVDFNTGNPDAWLNWYGATDEVGKVYKQPLSGDYFVITKQIKHRNSGGNVTRAEVWYDVYADYIWDSDEQKYMGVLKLGTFKEDIDMNTRQSTGSGWNQGVQ